MCKSYTSGTGQGNQVPSLNSGPAGEMVEKDTALSKLPSATSYCFRDGAKLSPQCQCGAVVNAEQTATFTAPALCLLLIRGTRKIRRFVRTFANDVREATECVTGVHCLRAFWSHWIRSVKIGINNWSLSESQYSMDLALEEVSRIWHLK